MNAKKYFKKYTKLKNACEIVSKQKQETKEEINYIESIVLYYKKHKEKHIYLLSLVEFLHYLFSKPHDFHEHLLHETISH